MIIRFLLLFALIAWHSNAQRFVKSYSTVAQMVAANPVDINTNIFVAGYYSANDGGEGSFRWNANSSGSTNLGTVFKAQGMNLGRLERVYSGPINVKWFGAKGDGIADDTAAFRAVTNAFVVGNNASQVSQQVFIPPGYYKVSGPIAFQIGTEIRGAGVYVTTITNTTMSDTIYMTNAVSAVGAKMSVSGLSIFGPANSTNGAAITVSGIHSANNAPTPLINNVNIEGHKFGILLTNCVLGELDAVRITATSSNGIHSVGSMNAVSFRNVYSFQSQGHGFYVASANYCSFLTCASELSAYDGYHFGAGVGSLVTSTMAACGAEVNSGSGFYFENPKAVHLSACYTALNGSNGFTFRGGEGVVVTAAQAEGDNGYGISITNSATSGAFGYVVMGTSQLSGSLGLIDNPRFATWSPRYDNNSRVFYFGDGLTGVSINYDTGSLSIGTTNYYFGTALVHGDTADLRLESDSSHTNYFTILRNNFSSSPSMQMFGAFTNELMRFNASTPRVLSMLPGVSGLGGVNGSLGVGFTNGQSALSVNGGINAGATNESPAGVITAQGAGQTNANPVAESSLGGSFLAMDDAIVAGNGGMYLFGAGGTKRFAAFKGSVQNGNNLSIGDVIFASRENTTDPFLTEHQRFGLDGTFTTKFLIVSNAMTFPNGTANSVAKFDSLKRLTNVVNGLGALTNDGSGNIGYFNLSSIVGAGGGNVFNTGTPAIGNVPSYTDTTGTNISPTSISITLGTNLFAGTLTVTNNSLFQNVTASKVAVFDANKRLTNGTIDTANIGTVTSVGFTAPAQFGVAGSPVTSSGTLALSWANVVSNRFLAGPINNSADAAPTFRLLSVSDFNSGTSASSATYWRGDGTWSVPPSATGGNLFVATESKTVANTVTETSIMPNGVGTNVLPAAYLTLGKNVHFVLRGRLDTATPTPGFLRIRVKLNAVQVWFSQNIPVAAGLNTNTFNMDGDISVRSTGLTGTVWTQCNFLYPGVVDSTCYNVPYASYAAITVDTTSENTLDVTAEWSIAEPANQITTQIAVINDH